MAIPAFVLHCVYDADSSAISTMIAAVSMAKKRCVPVLQGF